jgi:hypothetical protein
VLRVVEVEVVEVGGVNGGGDTVAEHEAMTKQMTGATKAAPSLDIGRPLTTLTSKPP